MTTIAIINKTIGTELNSVNARELHSFLQSDIRFNDWISRRIKKYEFIENQDYIKITTKVGNATAYDYFITLDVAKELCMVENNEKGREARRYFIEAEKQLLNIRPNHYQILGYKSQIAQHNKKIYQLEDRIITLSSQLEKAKINNINNHSDNIIKLIDKGLKYDKLNNQFCELYSEHTELKSAMKKISNMVDSFRPK